MQVSELRGLIGKYSNLGKRANLRQFVTIVQNLHLQEMLFVSEKEVMFVQLYSLQDGLTTHEHHSLKVGTKGATSK